MAWPNGFLAKGCMDMYYRKTLKNESCSNMEDIIHAPYRPNSKSIARNASLRG